MSLTLGYLPNYTGGAVSTLADIDGENSTVTNAMGPDSYSIVSLADTALAQAKNSAGYVTLVVNVTPGSALPSGLAFHQSAVQVGRDNKYTVTSAPILQGVGPVQPLPNHRENLPPLQQLPYYTAWVNTVTLTSTGGAVGDPYVVLDLTQFGDFWDTKTNDDTNSACTVNSGATVCTSPLILTVRSTMPAASFASSAFSVPYSTAEYTNSDLQGAGFMGPYVPQLDYAAVGAFTNEAQNTCGVPGDTPLLCPALFPPPAALQLGDLPATGGFTSHFPGANMNILATASQQSWFPQQYWPGENGGTTNPPNLNCSVGSSSFTPQIDFVATQFSTQVLQSGVPTAANNYCTNADTTASPNPCVQTFQQAQQTEVNAYQPPLPVTIVGSGFGYLSGLPWAGTLPAPANLVVQDTTQGWSTGSGACVLYVSDWTDNAISLQVGLPTTPENSNHLLLYPLTDMSPLTFFAPASSVPCLISPGDSLTFTVKNQQQPGNTSAVVSVTAVGTPTGSGLLY